MALRSQEVSAIQVPPPNPPLSRLAVPSLLTLGNAGCGFVAIASLASLLNAPPDLNLAAWLVFGGWFFDMIDGSVASALKANSAFGGQLDSLCDAVTFGVVPGVLVMATGGPWAGVAGFAFTSAVLVRLARFNVAPPGDHLYFTGLSSPSGALAIASAVLAMAWARAHGGPLPWLGLAMQGLAVALAALMLSRVRYADLPKHYAKRLKPWWQLVPALVLLVALPLPLALFMLAAGYALWGAIAALAPRGADPELG